MKRPVYRDHSASKPLSDAAIKEIATRVREVLDPYPRSDFDVVAAVQRLTERDLFGWGRLEIELICAKEGEDYAQVELTPNGKKLFVDKDIWEEARIGEPYARYVISHEIGHLILHDCYVQPYSDETKSVYDDEKSTERQAHSFARYSLVRDSDIAASQRPQEVAFSCSVNLEVVVKRLGRRVQLTGQFCDDCGSSKVYAVDKMVLCASCGKRQVAY